MSKRLAWDTINGTPTTMQRMLTATAVGLGLAAMVAACGSGEQAERDQQVEAPAATERYAQIAPFLYMGTGNECALRLDDEFDGAITLIVGGGRPALAACAQVRDSGEWVVVDGVLSVENVAGQARVLSIPPDNASMFADAPASLEALAVGHVRVTAALGDMTGSGVIEIVAE